MGLYVPKRFFRKTVSDTINEAEDDHFFDCPSADFRARAAAILLDSIFLFILGYGLNSVFRTLGVALESDINLSALLPSVKLAIEAVIGYAYLWSIHQWGGSPAKILLGLRILDIGSGRKLRMSKVLLRECLFKPLSLISIVGMLMPLFRVDRLALHDLFAGSVVKRIHEGL